MALQQIQKDLLVGTLLGDGNLQTETKGRTWRYRALQTAAHKPYLDSKYDILKNYCDSPPSFQLVTDPRTNKTQSRWYFNTKVDKVFRYYGNQFYSFDANRNLWIKDVPLNIEKLLTERSIAYWYMDDGALKWLGKSNAMRICTESFSEDGVRRLQNALKKKFGIETQLTRKTSNGTLIGHRLAINEKNSTPFQKLIEPYLVPCMRYKVSDGNKGHL